METTSPRSTPTAAPILLIDIDPTWTPGACSVVVDTGAGTATTTAQITILDQAVPVVASFSPTMGASGTTVTASGTDLDQVVTLTLYATGGAPIFPTITNQTATSFDFVVTGAPGVYEVDQMTTVDCGTQFPDVGPTFTIQ